MYICSKFVLVFMRYTPSEIRRLSKIAKRMTGAYLQKKVSVLFSDKTYVRNVFQTSYPKNALIVYLPDAFKSKKLHKRHTNLTECYTAGKVLSELGYNVDAIDRLNKSFSDWGKYDLIYGTAVPVDATDVPVKIMYAPGASGPFVLQETIKKVKGLIDEKGKGFFSSMRMAAAVLSPYGFISSLVCDGVIVLGNGFVKKHHVQTDPDHPERFYNLPCFYFPATPPDLDKKDFEKAKSHILWFGSMSLMHKGLDICMDIALAHPEISLHICGALKRESDFWHYYNPLIKQATNIIDHGFVNIDSPEFTSILEQCAFVVSPSISEGGAAALLNVVGNGGLIPIYSENCGLDFAEIGYEIKGSPQKADFERVILESSRMEGECLRKMSKIALSHVRQNYTLEQYHSRLKAIIEDILRRKQGCLNS